MDSYNPYNIICSYFDNRNRCRRAFPRRTFVAACNQSTSSKDILLDLHRNIMPHNIKQLRQHPRHNRLQAFHSITDSYISRSHSTIRSAFDFPHLICQRRPSIRNFPSQLHRTRRTRSTSIISRIEKSVFRIENDKSSGSFGFR